MKPIERSSWCIGCEKSSPRWVHALRVGGARTSRASWRSASAGRALAREISWLPAVENKGEGIFLQFKDEAIDEWMSRPT